MNRITFLEWPRLIAPLELLLRVQIGVVIRIGFIQTVTTSTSIDMKQTPETSS
jgi:hypothetical protein